MSAWDWAIVAGYLIYVVYDGVKRSHGTEHVRGYFLANRSLPWWAVGLSVMATQMSAITLVGTTGQGYVDGMRFIQFYFGLPLAMVVLCMTAVPFFHKADVYTAYEFLEKRFDARTRTMTSLFFLISRGLSCGVIIAAPAVILSIMLGWNLQFTVLLIGVPTALYTMVGGVQAVTWTDVKQMLLILTGMAVCVAVILEQLPEEITLSKALHIAGASAHLQSIDFNLDLRETYTFWSGLLGGFFLMLSYFGCDQSQVQRYLTAKSIDQARTSLLMSAFVKIPIQFVILLMGILVFVFYQFHSSPLLFHPAAVQEMRQSSEGEHFAGLERKYQVVSEQLRRAALELGRQPRSLTARHDHQLALQAREELRKETIQLVQATRNDAAFSDVNYVFPSFVTRNMPVGITGLMIAAIFAGAMSSISSELNSLATSSVMDFYRRHVRTDASDRHYLKFSKLATGFWGLLACVVAMYAAHLGSLIEVVNKFGSFFYGSLLGVFVLASISRWVTNRGAFFGLLAGMATVAITSITTDISFLWYNLVGVVSVVLSGLTISWTEKRIG